MEEKITVEEYRELKMAQDDKLYQIQIQLDELTEKIDPISEYLSSYVPMLENLLDFYRSSDGKTKKRILSCIFSEKIHFDENRDAAISYSTPISILLNASKVLGGLKKEQEVKNDLLSTLAPPSGLEPETL
jgi:site-specific DNA recombinase